MASRLSEDGAFVFGAIDESGEAWFNRISEYGILGTWIPSILVAVELTDGLAGADGRALMGKLARSESYWAGDLITAFLVRGVADAFRFIDVAVKGQFKASHEISVVGDVRQSILGLMRADYAGAFDAVSGFKLVVRMLAESTSMLSHIASRALSVLVEAGGLRDSGWRGISLWLRDVGLLGSIHDVLRLVLLSELALGTDKSTRVAELAKSTGLAVYTKSQTALRVVIESLARVLGLRAHTPTISAYGYGLVGDSISGSVGKGVWEFLKPTHHRGMVGLKNYGDSIKAGALYSGGVLKPSMSWYGVSDKSATTLLRPVLAECGLRDCRAVFTERHWLDVLAHRPLILLDGLLQRKTGVALGRPESSVHASISGLDVLLWSGQASRDIHIKIPDGVRLFGWQTKRIPRIIAELFERALLDLLKGLFRDADVLLNIDGRAIRAVRDTVIVYPCECRITPTVGYTHAIIEYSCDIEIYTAGQGRHERLASMVRRVKEAVMGLHGVGEFYIILVGDADYKCTYGSPGLSCTSLRIRARRAQGTL